VIPIADLPAWRRRVEREQARSPQERILDRARKRRERIRAMYLAGGLSDVEIAQQIGTSKEAIGVERRRIGLRRKTLREAA
jgi:DNA-binding CsgD family transcriptional regulator